MKHKLYKVTCKTDGTVIQKVYQDTPAIRQMLGITSPSEMWRDIAEKAGAHFRAGFFQGLDIIRQEEEKRMAELNLNNLCITDGELTIPIANVQYTLNAGSMGDFTLELTGRPGVPHRRRLTQIKRVIFSAPATIVLWKDGTKTIVKCQPGDVYSKELGLAMCIAKKVLGNRGNYYNTFRKWIGEE